MGKYEIKTMRMRGASEGGRSMKYPKIPSPVKIQSVLIGYEAFSYTVGSEIHILVQKRKHLLARRRSTKICSLASKLGCKDRAGGERY